MIVPVLYDSYARIRNALNANLSGVTIRYNKQTLRVISLLYSLGYISNYMLTYKHIKHPRDLRPIRLVSGIYIDFNKASYILKYIKPISKPSRRVYISYKKLLKRKYSGHELTVLSTNLGVITKTECILNHVGGELLFIIKREF